MGTRGTAAVRAITSLAVFVDKIYALIGSKAYFEKGLIAILMIRFATSDL